jgi:tetratricopeptide (TPR) repeat protein
VPLHGVARSYFRRATSLARELGNPSALATALTMASIHGAGAGDWANTRAWSGEASTLASSIGDNRRWIECACITSTVAHYEGDFRSRLSLGQRVYELACRGKNVQGQAWGLLDQAESLVALGQSDEALAKLEDVKPLLHQNVGRSEEIWTYGLAAKALLQTGQLGPAREAADAAAAMSKTTPPTAMYVMEGYAGIAETYLALWEMSRAVKPEEWSAEVEEHAQSATKILGAYGRVFPIGQPRYNLLAGSALWLRGNVRRAERMWRRARACAERLKMPYEEGRALYEIGRHQPLGEQRRAILTEACDRFGRLDAGYDLMLARRASEARTPSEAAVGGAVGAGRP